MQKNKKSIIEYILTAIVAVGILAFPILFIAMIWGYSDILLVRIFLTIFVISGFSFLTLVLYFYED